MRAHYLQHVPYEGLGSIGPWLEAAGYEITSTRFFQSAELPEPGNVDWLIVMGGPMSANDEDTLPWLVHEKRFIRGAIQAGKPVLGICLGAQLIASAMGARVFPNPTPEIGWLPVEGVSGGEGGFLAVAAADHAVFRFSPSMEVFQWHGDTFDLPRGAVQLARSEACENQAFQLGRAAIGLQFHLETTPESARAMVSNGRGQLVPSTYVQSEAEILAAGAPRYASMNAGMDDVLSFLCKAAEPRD